MSYRLGVDLGTTYTAAAVARDGRAEIVGLGNRSASIPSVVLAGADRVLVGEPAQRRAPAEPDLVAREFKRRVGDPTPLVLGGTPWSPEALVARLLRWVVDAVVEREGGRPEAVTIGRPANWGPYKQDLLNEAIRLADVGPVSTCAEPEAAAIAYAAAGGVEEGDVVAVYDLGGGSFDAAVIARTAAGFEIRGTPAGIDRLGGVDFDAAVLAHVRRAVHGKLEGLDREDPAVVAAMARLRSECVEAKEALSSDTEAAIPVVFPNLHTEVRITRGEFEAMIRPALAETIDALGRVLRSAGLQASYLRAVLLVGGSSRIPLVSEMVRAELDRPAALNAHPKHAIALGLALGNAETAAREVVPQQAPPTSAPRAPGDPATTAEAVITAASRAARRTALLIGLASVALAVLAVVVWRGSDAPSERQGGNGGGAVATATSTVPGDSDEGAVPVGAAERAQAMIRAWQTGDRAAALALGDQSAVDELFAIPTRPAPSFDRCYVLSTDRFGCQFDRGNATVGVEVLRSGEEFFVQDVALIPY